MLENDDAPHTQDESPAPTARPRRRRAASRPAGPPEPSVEVTPVTVPEPAEPVRSTEPVGADQPGADAGTAGAEGEDDAEAAATDRTVEQPGTGQAPADDAARQGAVSAPFATTSPERRPRRRATAAAGPPAADIFTAPPALPDFQDLLPPPVRTDAGPAEPAAGAPGDEQPAPRTGRGRRGRRRAGDEAVAEAPSAEEPTLPAVTSEDQGDDTPAAPTEKPAGRARRTRGKAPREVPAPDGTGPDDAPAADGAVTVADDDGAGSDGGRTGGSQVDGVGPDGARGAAEVHTGAGSAPDDEDEPRTEQDGSDDEGPQDGRRRGGRSRRRRGGRGRGAGNGGDEGDTSDDGDDDGQDDADGSDGAQRRRGTSATGVAEADGTDDDEGDASDEDEDDTSDEDEDGTDASGGSRSSRRRRRRRRRSGSGPDDLTADPDDPPGTVVRIRESRADEVTKVKGSTRLEAKRQRRRDGRGASRKRTVITEAEFLTRRESVDRTLLVREGEDRTEIAVLEDGVLVEHHVTRASQQSMIGNVYLGKVQNVLPSMEAAFVDIGRGRNAVLYAGEVNWDAVGLSSGAQRKIEDALKPGDPVLAQVSKDPIGHKGARLTAQVSLPGRYLVYVPGSSMTGISRKLPENERTRLKKVLRRVVPEDAGVIVRTAAEGASETELERDVARLKAQWEDIEAKSKAVQAPARLYSEPDLAIKVVRDVFNEDFTRLVVSGDDTWDTLDGYVRHVAPDLAGRMSRWAPEDGAEQDLFVHHRIDEQIAKALDRKVWLPSGGSLVIDRTEAMTVVDVNTGKYTGNGGNLEETVTRNNLEAAEEIVRQLRLRDIGGIIVVDFIDMVLENNRNLVLRRLVECLGRDRTKHQVAEVTSLGLVQLTRKRVGSGLLESFSTPCEHCQGRGLVTHSEPVGAGNEAPVGGGEGGGRGGGGGGGRRRGGRSGS